MKATSVVSAMIAWLCTAAIILPTLLFIVYPAFDRIWLQSDLSALERTVASLVMVAFSWAFSIAVALIVSGFAVWCLDRFYKKGK